MSCSSCSANMHGGCVDPDSPLAFDEPVKPYGTCDRYTRRVEAAPEMQPVPKPAVRASADPELQQTLSRLTREHARNDWRRPMTWAERSVERE